MLGVSVSSRKGSCEFCSKLWWLSISVSAVSDDIVVIACDYQSKQMQRLRKAAE